MHEQLKVSANKTDIKLCLNLIMNALRVLLFANVMKYIKIPFEDWLITSIIQHERDYAA
ncbi:MAG: hypothetical protein V4543_00510 [Bacteroidota bacterium]